MNTVSVEKYDLSIKKPPFLTDKVGEFTYTDEEYQQAVDTHGASSAGYHVFSQKVHDMGYWMQFYTIGDGYAYRVVVWDSVHDYYNHIEGEGVQN